MMRIALFIVLLAVACAHQHGQFVYKTSEEMGAAWKKAHPNVLIIRENALYIEFEEKK